MTTLGTNCTLGAGKPRIRIPCISVFVGATPSESPLPTPPPVSPTEAGNLSVSAVNPATGAGTIAGPCFTDPTDPAIVNSVSAPNNAGTAAVYHSFTGSGSAAAATIPDMPAFLKRGADNIAPFSLAPAKQNIPQLDPRIAGPALRSEPSQREQSTEQGCESEPNTHAEAF